jgi:hypothetical protein
MPESETPPIKPDPAIIQNLPEVHVTADPRNLPLTNVAVNDSAKATEPSLPVIGLQLSRFVLIIISGFILILVVLLFVKEFDASNNIQIPAVANIPDSTYSKKIELVKLLQEEKKNYRDFVIQITQMVLLNLLLPVLTAILGYIFGSNKNRD